MAQIKYNLGDLGKEVYSTNETIVGTWIDGKPLYRKVVDLNCPTCTRDGVYVDVSTDVSSLNIDYIMFKNINVFCTSYNCFMSYDRIDVAVNTGASVWYDITNKNIGVRSNSTTYNGGSITAIIEYTKTTDA